MATTPNRREHDRIEIKMRTRAWLEETIKGKPVQFEGFVITRDLSIGGCFIDSTYLLPIGYPINLDMTTEEEDILSIRGEITHILTDEGKRDSGMGIRFTEVDAENRERLLRFFVSDRIKDFYFKRFVVEFPHLENVLTLKDVALTINLWEDREGRLTALARPDSAGAERARRREEARAARAKGKPA